MPRRGIHPALNKMTYVFRNGASVELPSVMFSRKPIIMQVVRRHRLLPAPAFACSLELQSQDSYTV